MKVKLKDLIIPTRLDNTDNNAKYGNREFETEDLIWLRSGAEQEALDEEWQPKEAEATDYIVLNGCLSIQAGDTAAIWPSIKPCEIIHRSVGEIQKNRHTDNIEICFDTTGFAGQLDGWWDHNRGRSAVCFGLRPVFRIDTENFNALNTEERHHIRSVTLSVRYKGKRDASRRLVIELGEYPQTNCYDKEGYKLENLLKTGNPELKLTGKTYTGYMKDDGTIVYNPEYEYQGKKYVRVKTKRYNYYTSYANGVQSEKAREYEWFKVEPIKWIMRNGFGEVPYYYPEKSVPYVELESLNAIVTGIPFYPNCIDKNRELWQNSTIRGYLNGINVNNIKTNGNLNYTAPNGGDFTNKNNFISEALEGVEFELTTEIKKDSETTIETKPENNEHNSNNEQTSQTQNGTLISAMITDNKQDSDLQISSKSEDIETEVKSNSEIDTKSETIISTMITDNTKTNTSQDNEIKDNNQQVIAEVKVETETKSTTSEDKSINKTKSDFERYLNNEISVYELDEQYFDGDTLDKIIKHENYNYYQAVRYFKDDNTKRSKIREESIKIAEYIKSVAYDKFYESQIDYETPIF